MSATYFFAGGGTGGHIYPALAVAQQLKISDPEAEIFFFCSQRPIDTDILTASGFDFIKLPASGFSLRPDRLIRFITGFFKSRKTAHNLIRMAQKPIIIGVGGFVAAPVITAGKKLKAPLALINVDIVPGKSNKLFASKANEIYLQFDKTKEFFRNTKAHLFVTGCPLRQEFASLNRNDAIRNLNLDPDKKTILVTGASSGANNINQAMIKILPLLETICSDWQVIHLTGKGKSQQVRAKYENSSIPSLILDYYEQMHELLACADIIIGRSGAVSIAEYKRAAVPAICIPYPYHKDKHQYLNADTLVKSGAAMIVEDNINDNNTTANNLFEAIKSLITDNTKRADMIASAQNNAGCHAEVTIAQRLIGLSKDAK